jgi:hypothetical protein
MDHASAEHLSKVVARSAEFNGKSVASVLLTRIMELALLYKALTPEGADLLIAKDPSEGADFVYTVLSKGEVSAMGNINSHDSWFKEYVQGRISYQTAKERSNENLSWSVNS